MLTMDCKSCQDDFNPQIHGIKIYKMQSCTLNINYKLQAKNQNQLQKDYQSSEAWEAKTAGCLLAVKPLPQNLNHKLQCSSGISTWVLCI
jgi:hypothetical protein